MFHFVNTRITNFHWYGGLASQMEHLPSPWDLPPMAFVWSRPLGKPSNQNCNLLAWGFLLLNTCWRTTLCSEVQSKFSHSRYTFKQSPIFFCFLLQLWERKQISSEGDLSGVTSCFLHAFLLVLWKGPLPRISSGFWTKQRRLTVEEWLERKKNAMYRRLPRRLSKI